MGLKQLLHTQTGGYIISVILGLGLASLFRKACRDRKCIKFEAPSSADIEKFAYRYDNKGKCLKYTPHATKCDTRKHTIEMA
jgi:hypothetical protein